MNHYPLLGTCLIDLLDRVLRGDWVEALNRYYHPQAWLPEPVPLPPFLKGAPGRKALDRLTGHKGLCVERVESMGIGQDTTFITWVYSGTLGAALTTRFTVMSLQHWENGKIVHEAYLHAN